MSVRVYNLSQILFLEKGNMTMIQISQLRLPCGRNPAALEKKIRKKLKIKGDEPFKWKILRHSVDARKKTDLMDVYTVGVDLGGKSREEGLIRHLRDRNIIQKKETVYHFPETPEEAKPMMHRPVVIGMGPAGLFCALLLAEHGYRPIVLERGAAMEERCADVEYFWKTGELNPDSNIQFGEGGAGTFSDGKLTTGVKDRSGRRTKVIDTFIEAGAPEDIAYEQIPHIGTDRLREVIVSLRKRLIDLGGEVRFHSRADRFLTDESGSICGLMVQKPEGDYELKADCVVLAPGHSSRDTLRTLYGINVPMTQKAFALGFRVSHPQSLIDQQQYGISDPETMQKLHLAHDSYKLTAKAKDGKGVYSFCMCPGGYIVNASSEKGRLAVNGMSNYARDSRRANSAIVMTVGKEDFGSDDVLAGMHFQEKLEEKAYRMADGRIPIESYPEFKENAASDSDTPVQNLTEEESDSLCIKGRAARAPLHKLLPAGLTRDFIEGMEQFNRKIPGFTGSDAYVCGLESRTSSPVRITRDEHFESGIRGLYPCGEGAGYAGGITSAAIDGIKVAEAVAIKFKPVKLS